RFPQSEEGVLTRLRASLVKRETLADIAREMELGAMLKLGPGERKSGGWRRESILANSLEAVIGAIYLDSDMASCRDFILGLFRPKLEVLKPDTVGKDPKTTLQEVLQENRLPLPSYEVVEQRGEPHKRIFTVRCKVECLPEPVTAEGRSKRVAEQAAAKKALQLIQSVLS
ncbi:MAG: ribonuclease III, partial [Gammaproteobacteria bacterium]